MNLASSNLFTGSLMWSKIFLFIIFAVQRKHSSSLQIHISKKSLLIFSTFTTRDSYRKRNSIYYFAFGRKTDVLVFPDLHFSHCSALKWSSVFNFRSNESCSVTFGTTENKILDWVNFSLLIFILKLPFPDVVITLVFLMFGCIQLFHFLPWVRIYGLIPSSFSTSRVVPSIYLMIVNFSATGFFFQFQTDLS